MRKMGFYNNGDELSRRLQLWSVILSGKDYYWFRGEYSNVHKWNMQWAWFIPLHASVLSMLLSCCVPIRWEPAWFP
jgi:hypothetical protein